MKKHYALLVFLMVLCATLSSSALQAQTKVSGKVLSSEDNTPVVGASVFAPGTNAGSITDSHGAYTITVPTGAKMLEFSFMGFKTVEFPIAGKTIINVQMDPETLSVDEVMVVAYGVSKKSSFTGSASQIDSKKLELRPISNITQALSGMSPGVQVGISSGQPGSNATIRIRGIGSMNGSNDPLVVVDGAPYESPISNISPDDIESMTILKDAASSALYGARAANGVLVITTKKGSKERLNISVKVNQGITNRQLPEYDRIGRDEFYPLNWEKYRNSLVTGGMPADIAAKIASGHITEYDGKNYGSIVTELSYNPYNVPNNQIMGLDGKLNPNAKFLWADDLDWLNELQRTGSRGDYSVALSGANDKTDYYFSVGYTNEEGFIENSNFRRYSARVNINSQAKKWLKMGLNVGGNMSSGNNQDGYSSTELINPFYVSRFIGPIYPVYLHDPETGAYILDDAGKRWYDFGTGKKGLPTRPFVASHNVIPETRENVDEITRSLLSVKTYAEFKFLKDFKFVANVGLDYNSYLGGTYKAKFPGDAASPGRASRTASFRAVWNLNQILSWNKSFGKHNLDVMAGHESYTNRYHYLTGDKDNQVTEGNYELVNFTTISGLTSYRNDYRTEGILTRLNYNFDEKYLFSGSFRHDGSSKFNSAVRWGNFWSVSAAWRMEREAFLKGVDFIDQLKVRGSFGQVGNDGGISNYAWQSLYAIRSNANEPGYAQTSLGNRDLVWETGANFDVAVEFGFFRRLNGSIEFFNRQSSNLLYPVPLTPSIGISEIDMNTGTMYNRGFEFHLAGDIIQKKNFIWNLDVNATTIKNKITKMPVEPYIDGTKRIAVGQSRYDYWLRQYWGVDPNNGDALYLAADDAKDVREIDGVKLVHDLKQAKYEYSGSSIPKLYGGITNTFNYKNLSLTILLTYQLGGKSFDGIYESLMGYTSSSYGRTMHQDIRDRWQTPGQKTAVPRLDVEDATNQNSATSTRWLFSSNALDITSINLTYNLPKKYAKAIGLQNLRVYLSGDNIYQFNKRKGMNVRQSFAGTNSNTYTPARIINLGLNLNF